MADQWTRGGHEGLGTEERATPYATAPVGWRRTGTGTRPYTTATVGWRRVITNEKLQWSQARTR